MLILGRSTESPSGRQLVDCAEGLGWRTETGASDIAPALVVVSEPLTGHARRACGDALLVGVGDGVDEREVDLLLPNNPSIGLLRTLLVQAERVWLDSMRLQTLRTALELGQDQIRQLAEIGTTLTAERNDTALLERILREARRLASCEAGSLYLVEQRDGERCLSFKLAQNDLRPIALAEGRLPLTPASLAGFVALSGQELRISDAYEIPDNAPYQFNRSVDQATDYRTRSMLVLPMRDHRDDVIGVLQFINRTRRDEGVDCIVEFDDEIVALLRAVASQAAVAMQKNNLILEINDLFESFVQASVKAIEQRDPSTSGHSFRVAETTTTLLKLLPQSGLPRFRELAVTDEHLREVRYAALLHDFGKVGVRESILLKANKLTDEGLELLRYRFALHAERLRNGALQKELEELHRSPDGFEVGRRRIRRDLERDLGVLDDYFSVIEQCNRPRVLDEGVLVELDRVRALPFLELDGSAGSLIGDRDLTALTIRRGSLTEAERREIESHVSFTRDFLSVLPWPPELLEVPAIAAAHHEKLDGSGYPDGLTDERIPLPSKVMAVCDIYDALTAMDRPYKKAVPNDRAFSILEDEAAAGLIDSDLVKLFIDARVYETVKPGQSAERQAG